LTTGIADPRPIEDVCLGIYDGPHATPKEADDGPIFLGIKNITEDGRLDFAEIRYVSEDDFEKWTRRVTPQAGDVVFTYEATLHRYAMIPEGFRGCLGRRVALVRPDPEQVDSRFLLYYFRSASWRQVVEASVITGATVDRVPLERFPSFPVRLPDLTMQTAIADVLSPYDELIENNRRRIALLEEATRQLHREWFVRRRFPGHEHTQQSDGIPDGWRRACLGDLCEEVRASVKPAAVEPETPYIGLEHMPRRSITLGAWSTADQVTSSKHAFREGDILFGKIRPYFHKVGIAFVDGIASSDAIVIRPTEARYHALVLTTLSSDPFVAVTAQTMREGSKMPRADWEQMKRWGVAVPPEALLTEFQEAVGLVGSQLKSLALANQRLQAARDLLLPRLISGTLAV
jgi:type I restriction enzyme S subunit